MDDFDFGSDGAELSTSIMNFSFGPAGRIVSLWSSEGAAGFGADQQFISSPIAIGDESTDEYLPGSILIGTRSDPEEPWIVGRNTGGEVRSTDDGVEIDYEFSLQSDLDIKGKFFENPEKPGVVVWEITIRNKSRQSIEIGELGFPFALQNILEGFPVTDEGMNTLLTERLVLQKHIGGAGSYLAARKVCGDPPGLLIFPGEGTSFEFYHSSMLSLRASMGWQGLPIFYIHSQATIEREGWTGWYYENSTLVMEPKESKTFQVCIAPILARHGFDIPVALAEYGVPCFRPVPSMVVPMDVPFALEVAGTRPAEIYTEEEVESIEMDSDEHGGVAIIENKKTGQNRVFVRDMADRISWAHYFAIMPIRDLTELRAKWICTNQIIKKGPFKHGIAPVDLTEAKTIIEEFDSVWTIVSSLADARFLAEKLRIYFEPDQTKLLDNYIEKFLLMKFHKPGQGTIGAICPNWEGGIAMDASRPQLYVHAIRLYLSCADLARTAKLSRSEQEYRDLAEELVNGLIRVADREGYIAQALYGAEDLLVFPQWQQVRGKFLDRWRLPFWHGRHFSAAPLGEVSALAERSDAVGATGSVEQLGLSLKSFAPNWWSFGSEPRPAQDHEGHGYLPDFGEVYPSYTSVSTSIAMTSWLKRDYTRLDEPGIRLAMGGMLAPWVLVRMDGAIAMGICPDMASSQRSIIKYTGDAGLALGDYLRHSTCYLLSSFERGFVPVGLMFETYPHEGMTVLRLEPYDGVARKVVVRHLNLSVEVEGCKIDVVEFDVNLRWLKLALDNPTEAMKRKTTVKIDGLWGTKLQVDGKAMTSDKGILTLETVVEPGGLKEIEVRVVS